MKYRKKPIIVEAFQMTQERRWDNKDWPGWLNLAWNKSPDDIGSLFINPVDTKRERLVIATLEGLHEITWNDWIIQGIKGELYACKPDIFEMTYERTEQDKTA